MAPDSEYPDWVADLAKPPAKLTELRREWMATQPAADDLDVFDVDTEQLGRLLRFENRAKIKAKNSAAGTFGGL